MSLTEIILKSLSFIGSGTSWITEKIIKFISSLGIGITPLQSKILTFLILGIFIYVVWSILNIGKKLLKFAIIMGLLFLLISVVFSVFIP